MKSLTQPLSRRAGHVGMAALCAVIAVPLIAVVWAVFADGGAGWAHLRDRVLATYVITTASLMIMVGVLSTIFGVMAAWFVARTEFWGRRAFSFLLVLPLAAPSYIIAYLYTDLLDVAGPVQSWLRTAFSMPLGAYWFPEFRNIPGAALFMSLVLYPYIYVLSRVAFGAQTGTQFDAARSLGRGPLRAFWQIALPAARPAIIGGLALVLMETLADYGVADYFALPTLSTGIFRSWILMGEKIAALKLAGTMLVFVIALLAAESFSRRARQYGDQKPGAAARRMRLTPIQQAGAIAFCGGLVGFGFILPLVVLGAMALPNLSAAQATFGAALNSVSVSLIGAIICVVIAYFLSAYARAHMDPAPRFMVRFSTLGYALPGALLAVAILSPLGIVDMQLTRWLRSLGYGGGLILSGTILLLVYAYVIRFLTVAFNTTESSLTQISKTLDGAARSLGASEAVVRWRIHLPLIRPGLGAAGILVFVDVMRELPLTLILRPFNFETLATQVYRLASDERLADASPAAAIIMLLGVVPVVVLNLVSTRAATSD